MTDAATIDAPLARLATDMRGMSDRFRTLAADPAVQRARPAILVVAVMIFIALVWMMIRSPSWQPLYADLADGDKAAVMTALQAGNYEARINPDTGGVEVAAGNTAAARILLAGQGLPKSARSIDPVGDMPLGLSRAVESARLQSAAAIELAASIEAIDGVKHATVHVAVPEPSVFVRDKSPPSASVFVTLAPGRALGEAQVRAIVWLVSSSVAGLSPDRVSVVDQSGALLSAGSTAGEAAQLGYQVKVEGLVRERLFKLLTPLVGAGKFTAEVAADVDFSRNEAASERYGPDTMVRSEAVTRSGETTPPPARGIPGALSNTAPAGAQLSATPPAAAAAVPGGSTINESTNRAFEIGKSVSVTRGEAPRLRRLSVAVVIDRPGKTAGGSQDIAAITRIIRGAMGFDAARGDTVEVQIRRFAAVAAEPARAWYQPKGIADNVPLFLGAAAAVFGLGLAVWQWQRSRRAIMAAASAASAAASAAATAVAGAAAGAAAGLAASAAVMAGTTAQNGAGSANGGTAPIDGGELGPAAYALLVDYRAKLGVTRGLVDDDADRATAGARQMLAAT